MNAALTLSEKKDLFRCIGDELLYHYKRGNISIYPEYDTSYINDSTSISELIKTHYVEPYYDLAAAGDSNKLTELQTVLAAITRVTKELDRIKEAAKEEKVNASSLTVAKALAGDKGGSYG